ncbi:MAG: 3'-5' exonuclease [Bacteroidetes bacterium]|nr:3'-5' exonuclease [Bacteroidota bacterium]
MLDQQKIEDILFLDIETVPVTYKYDDLNDNARKLWDNKFRFQTAETPEVLYKKAGIFAEFARIICISVGLMSDKNFRLKSFYGNDEKLLLTEFASMLNKHYNKKEHRLCAHNGKEFDYPFIARRMLINGIKLPDILNIAGKKPWEVNLLDTMELWKFGDYKNFTSLNLLAHIFDIPTPKDDIDGSDVSRVYYEEKNLKRIVTYCQKDVLTVAQVLLRFKGEPLIKAEQVIIT